MGARSELEEIAHTGGLVTFKVAVDSRGRVSYSIRWSHSRPTPAAMFAVYALPQGIAVGDIKLGGIGSPWNDPPVPNCVPVVVSSDSTGMFGRQCRGCNGYWRGNPGNEVCPYCGTRIHAFYLALTEAQEKFVSQYCELLSRALASGQPGDYTIDLDAVADAVGKQHEKPPFYYAEERQQNHFRCEACRNTNDVLGTYAYCAMCGTRNDVQELEKRIKAIRDRINNGGPYEWCAKEAVSAFDSFASQYAKQLRERIPLTKKRRTRVDRALFHNVDSASDLFGSIFNIDILAGVTDDDAAFARLMFHRRHVYEHNGGEADEKYIKDSGDQVRVKQTLRESKESAHRIANIVARLATNLHAGFHDIFPPLDGPIQRYRGASFKK